MSMRLKKVGDWIQYVTGQGPTFYYNDKNGEFQWVDPENNDESAGGGGAGESDWKPYKDPQTGNIFWYNRVSKISQWECPLETIPPELLLEESHNNNTSPSKYDEDDNHAVAVSHEDDLGI